MAQVMLKKQKAKKIDPVTTLKVVTTPVDGASEPVLTGQAINETYDRVIVAFSGGKDSVACFLRLIDLGVDRSKIELWHHDVDGQEGSTLMDWASTRGYCEAFSAAFGVPLFYSWKVGGFEGEMLRKDEPTAPTRFEVPGEDGGKLVKQIGGEGPRNTRLRFPQVAADLMTRWCSGVLKIDPASAAIRNQSRFSQKKTLFITGERAEESPKRAQYKVFEPHRTDTRDGRKKRHVDTWRPVHQWTETMVWEAMRRHRIRPAAPYSLGWSRLSCAACIFGNADQWASLKKINPAQFEKIAAYEKKFGVTIKRKESIEALAAKGKPYEAITDELAALATSHDYSASVILTPDEEWVLPAGAFGEGCGPA